MHKGTQTLSDEKPESITAVDKLKKETSNIVSNAH